MRPGQPPPEAVQAEPAARSWLVVALLCLSGALNYMDRQAVFSIFPLLRSEFAMSAVALSLLGTTFLVCYSLSSPIAGFCGDRFPRRRVILWSLAIFSGVTLASGLAPTGSALIVLRAPLGLSEALYMPAAVALIAGWHGARSRGLAIGLHQSSLLVGGVAGATLAGYIGDIWGWRPAFFALGLGGLALGLVFYRWLAEAPPAALTSPDRTRSPELSRSLGAVWRVATARCVIFNSFTVSMVTWVILAWMPSYLHDRFRLSLGRSALDSTLWANLAGLAALPLGGWLADRWSRRRPQIRAAVQGLGLVILIPAVLCLGTGYSHAWTVAGLAIYGVGQAFWNSGNMPILCDVLPAEARSTAYGLTNFSGTLGGGISVLLFAPAAERWGVRFVFSTLAVLLMLSLCLAILITLKFYRRDHTAVEAAQPGSMHLDRSPSS